MHALKLVCLCVCAPVHMCASVYSIGSSGVNAAHCGEVSRVGVASPPEAVLRVLAVLLKATTKRKFLKFWGYVNVAWLNCLLERFIFLCVENLL